MNKSIYTLEFKLFFRNTSTWIGIIMLSFMGFAGLYFGKTFIKKQEQVIEKAASLQKQQTAQNISYFGKDIGLFFYHNKFSVANPPGTWAAFANGQRDVNPYLISVTMLGLEGQLYDTDLSNPLSLLLGKMDLSFVFIFLFPLVIIAFSYNLLSEQKESGIWPLLNAQIDNTFLIIWRKFLVRLIVIFLLAIVLMLVAAVYLKLPFDATFAVVLALILLYLTFWFAVSFVVISINKSSNFNASVLIAVWVLLCIVVPASLNLLLTKKYPVPEALQNVINQREGYHEKWDMDKSVTMIPFFKHYPELKKYPFPDAKTFSWYWYYGMQQMGDDAAVASRLLIEKKLASRQYFTEVVALFFPSIQMQLGVNVLAGTDLDSHLDFQQAIRKYHESVRLHFYPAIFTSAELKNTDIETYKLEKHTPQNVPAIWINLLSITTLTVILAGLGYFSLKRRI
ncbi:DUF3526 domain-containing protein [Pedobacter sp. HDW13]|uniref:DUF3526 domain-containing protein n=1 Tax=unclassified Pedobacter TaxID=2628915 RepID=UPI000F5B2BAE|nr:MULTISPECIES: DUF3526 domain-containing protein [unclassified Pedobacter]QIL42128.1 DUF3526 domain-containing protein [Pedobacter sp. HDW13]RQO76637.1 ABC transporter permease [Pedobacter sp. KBW01]